MVDGGRGQRNPPSSKQRRQRRTCPAMRQLEPLRFDHNTFIFAAVTVTSTSQPGSTSPTICERVRVGK